MIYHSLKLVSPVLFLNAYLQIYVIGRCSCPGCLNHDQYEHLKDRAPVFRVVSHSPIVRQPVAVPSEAFDVVTMAPQIDISIPTTSTSSTSKPYTVYNVTLRLPLRSYTIQKRYSDFAAFHQSLTEQVGAPPPATLPAKSWFKSTISSPELTETRRQELEKYLQTINEIEDTRWRNTSVWRAFLNLPSSFTSSSSRAGALHSVLTGPGAGGAPIADPTVWLDSHRDLKAQLHDARLNLTNRDQASTPQKQHEASAAAKSALVKAGTLISALEDGLTQGQKSSVPSSQKLGAGELRRRKDLLSAARKDKDALENLLNAMSQKTQLDSAVANIQEHTDLLGSGNNQNTNAGAKASARPGRVLGKETAETRSLDNQGVLQLQQQKMKDQDLDVDEIRKIVQRQRELGVAINQELEIQNEMLKVVDEDVDRVQGKINVAKKRIGKIS